MGTPVLAGDGRGERAGIEWGGGVIEGVVEVVDINWRDG